LDTRKKLGVHPWRLPTETVEFLAQNVDDLLELEVDGEVVVTLEISSAAERTCTVSLVTEGGGAEFTDLGVARDIYYTSAGQRTTSWEIPADHFVMLGDNTQDSSDARDWNLTRFEVTTEDSQTELVRGNNRGTENPIIVADEQGKATVFMQDEFGERWVFPRDTARSLGPVGLSLVPRSLIRGRAVLVVWPLAPSLDIYRLKWVR
jgi:hypothetical protein